MEMVEDGRKVSGDSDTKRNSQKKRTGKANNNSTGRVKGEGTTKKVERSKTKKETE